MFPIKSAVIVFYALNFRTNEHWFLLGREGSEWSGFGGHLEKDETVEFAAARECYEETAGCIAILPELLQRLQNNDYRLVVDSQYNKSSTRTYFLQIPFNEDLPNIFSRTKRFAQHVHGKIDCIEKNALRWFSVQELEFYMTQEGGSGDAYPNRHRQHHAHSFNKKPFFFGKFVDVMQFFFSMPDAYRAIRSKPVLGAPPFHGFFIHVKKELPANHGSQNHLCSLEGSSHSSSSDGHSQCGDGSSRSGSGEACASCAT